MSDAVRTTLESGGPHPHPSEHVPTTAQSEGNEKPKTEWSAYMRNVYAGRKPPSIGSYDVAKLEERAREATEGYHGEPIFYTLLCLRAESCAECVVLGLMMHSGIYVHVRKCGVELDE